MPSSKAEGSPSNQEPTWRLDSGAPFTDGDDAAYLVSAYGYDLDPWQRDVLSQWLSRDDRDALAVRNAGLSVPRQNGKNALLESRELYGLLAMNERILHTAHEVKTARKAFLRLASFFENERRYPELAERVKSIRKTNGQEGIDLWPSDPETGEALIGEQGGGSIEFSARSRGAARGYTVDTVIFDEAQELTDEQIEALIPTLAASPSGNRQYIYTGTPPSPGSPGTVFARERETALHGTETERKGRVWHEWGVKALPRRDASLEELMSLAERVNPAWAYRLDADFVASEALTMSHEGFARERLGWWVPTVARANPISAGLWAESATDTADGLAKRTCFGVKFAADGSSVALAACKGTAKKAMCELVRVDTTEIGTQWLAEWLVGRKATACCVVVDGMGAADALCANMIELGSPRGYVVRPTASDVAGAAAALVDAMRDGKLKHPKQDALEKSALHSIKRSIGTRGGWGFGSTDAGAAEPIEACALAYMGARNSKRDPSRKQRML